MKHDIQFLIDDEIEAIEGYKKVLAKMSKTDIGYDLLTKIMAEEVKHFEELYELLHKIKD